MDSAITRLRDRHIDHFDPEIRAIVDHAASFACFGNGRGFNFSHDRDFYKVSVKIEGCRIKVACESGQE